jgi:acylphosphatase
VQGVYFRAFTKKKAKQLAIKGSVRNLADGRVEIIAEADEPNLEKFILWCHKGPITARVDQLDMATMAVDELLTRFEIR